jgi:membrane-associated PAP2 superfamily phosphatase
MLEHYRSADGRAFLLRQTVLLLGCALALSALFGDGRLDLAVSRRFFDAARNLFPLANHWLLKNLLHDAARAASAVAALVLLGSTAVAWVAPVTVRLHAHRRELLFASTAAVTAAVAVGALKHFSNHACPWDLAAFGGTAPLHPHSGAAPEIRGCFPAAHPVAGYAWLAAGFALRACARRAAHASWAAAGALGTLFGAVQIARGAHFPSHVLWSAWVVWAVNLTLLIVCAWLPALRLSSTRTPSACSPGACRARASR